MEILITVSSGHTRHDEKTPRGNVPPNRKNIRHVNSRPKILQRLRLKTGPIQPIHRMRRHIHKSHTKQQITLHLRRRGPNKRLIHVKDITKANLNALEHSNADYKAINIATGKPITIKKLAETLTKLYDKPNLQPHISSEYRKGDIRHCYADTQKARKLLNYEPSISLEDGLTKLAEWAKTQGWATTDLFEKALKELRERNLTA